MGFVAGVDDERAVATPVFVVGEAVDAINVVRGIGAGEGDPEEIVKGACGETAVIYDEDEGQAFERLTDQCFGEVMDVFGACVWVSKVGAFDGEDAGQDDGVVFECDGQGEFGGNGGR